MGPGERLGSDAETRDDPAATPSEAGESPNSSSAPALPKGWLAWALAILQAAFYIVVSVSTLFTLRITLQERRAASSPVVGIVRTQVIKALKPDATGRSYQDSGGFLVRFRIENIGSRPARNVIVRPRCRVGNTSHSFTESPRLGEGYTLFPGTPAHVEVGFGPEAIVEHVEHRTELGCNVYVEYSAWEEPDQRSLLVQGYDIKVPEKDPMEVQVSLVAPLAPLVGEPAF